jgi:hypothetical protein
MLDLFDFINLNGQIWHFNTDTCPLKEFTVEVDSRSEEVPRMQEHGIWPSHTYQGKMLIHINGDLLYNTPQLYIAGRLQMLNTLVPAGVVVNTRRMGTIRMQYTGQEVMYSDDVTLDAMPSVPMRALYPSVTEFDITFKVFRPYMIGAGSGRFYTI